MCNQLVHTRFMSIKPDVRGENRNYRHSTAVRGHPQVDMDSHSVVENTGTCTCTCAVTVFSERVRCCCHESKFEFTWQ